MTNPETRPDGFRAVADLEIEAVTLRPDGFGLQASGADGAEYLVELHLDMPMDGRTRSILGEMLSQTELRVWRRPREPLRGRWKRPAAPSPGVGL
jgi:hypothetical protein